MQQITYNLSEIKTIASQLWNKYNQFKIWALHAAMGAGKTTFIHALCDVLQVKDAVSSPTFAILNEYTSFTAGTVFHMDWYRLNNATEAVQAGCEDCIESNNYCFIEWPDKASQLLPPGTLHISFKIINENERRLIISTNQSIL